MITEIRTQEEYQAALERVQALFHSPEGSPEERERDALIALIVNYEEEHFFKISEADFLNPYDEEM